jgi:hypothetical protein
VVQLAHHPAQGYLLNMTLQALKEAIAELPAGEKDRPRQLAQSAGNG